MIKKNHFIKIFLNGCLLCLFFIGLLGFSTCSFAEFSEADIKNVIYNYSNYRGKTANEIEAWFETTAYQTFYEDFLSLYVNNANYDFCVATKGNYELNVCIQATNHTKTIISDNLTTGSTGLYFYKLFVVNTNNGSIQINNNTNYDKWITTRQQCYVYTYHFDIYQATNSTNITYTAPYNNLQYLTPTGPYTDNYLWGIADHLYDQINISGDNSNDIIQGHAVYKSYFNSTYSPYATWSLALLGGASDYLWTDVSFYRYNRFAQKWLLEKTGRINQIWDINEQNDSGFLYIDSNYLLSDSLVLVRIYGNNQYVIQPYFIYTMSDYTIINNGYLDITATINNYPTGFTYQDNTNMAQQEDTNDNITNIDTNSQVIADALTSTELASGEEPTFEDLPSIEVDDDSEEFFTWLSSEIVRVLEDDSDTTLTIPILDQEFEIESNYFVLENGLLRTFISVGWWFIVGVPFLKYIRSSVEKLKGGDIPGASDKDDLLNHIL